MKKGVLRNFAEFTGKHVCQSLFFNKVAGLKKTLWHRSFPVNIAKFLRTPFLQNTSGRLLLCNNAITHKYPEKIEKFEGKRDILFIEASVRKS